MASSSIASRSIFVLAGLAALSARADMRPKVIYGEDNRLDLFEVTNQADLALADSTVALMKASTLQRSGNDFTVRSSTLEDFMGVCKEERFSQQPTAAFCSGSLVGPDLILTAGHCIRQADCASTRFVFGFGYKKSGDSVASVPASEVYSCSRVLASQALDADFAVVKLDRPVVGHRPLAVNRGALIAPQTEIGVIGHPSGLPTKVAFGAQVRKGANGYFQANLDTYGGNSGSAVFNASTGVIEGILVRGEQDFEYKGNCMVSKKCSETGCRGEDITYVQQALSYIPE
jgi:V8-like Glu-specific endopeptidase